MTTAAPHSYQAWASVFPGGAAHVTLAAGGLDFDGSAHGDPTLPGPADLLAAALAACLSKNLERFSGILGFRYQRGRVTVRLERQDAPARIIRAAYLVEVTTEEPDERLQLLHRNLRKYGTITNTLAAACELSGELRRAAPGDDGVRPETPGPHRQAGSAPS
jgi:uncharacterized OsmC-like protein